MKIMNNPLRNTLNYFRLLALLCCGPLAMQSAHASDKLYHREVNEKNPGGKNLVMTFEETKREEKTSTVKVTMASGGSVPSAMFLMRCVYDIANIRKMKYLIKLSEKEGEDGSWTYVFGFSNDTKVNTQKHFGLKVPLPDDEGYKFMAVKDLDMIFKGKQ